LALFKLSAVSACNASRLSSQSWLGMGIGPDGIMHMMRDSRAAKRRVSLATNGELVEKTLAKGLNMSTLAEKEVAADFVRRGRAQWDAEITEACAAHERYLAEYESASELLRAHLAADDTAG
jgi:post-segregation antitoxin (ccd killing protein)